MVQASRRGQGAALCAHISGSTSIGIFCLQWAGTGVHHDPSGAMSTALLDAVEDNSGPVAADKVLALVSNICGWYATRHDDYSSPIIKGMRRIKSEGAGAD